jgi:hypothetical protein
LVVLNIKCHLKWLLLGAWHGSCCFISMTTWRGQNLEHLTREELERCSREAISELMLLSDSEAARQRAYGLFIAGVAGVGLALIAVMVGLMLR